MIRGVTDNVLPQDLDTVMRGLCEMARSDVNVQLALYMSLSPEQRQAAKSMAGMAGYVIDDYDDPGYDHGHGSMPHEFGDQ